MTIFDSNMKYLQTLKTIGLGVAILVAVTSCDKNRNKPGYSYFPDMEQSQAYETYTSNLNWENGRTNQLPVEGTVPREMIPYDFEKTDVNRVWAGQELENPYANNETVMEEGKRLYDIYCMHCHGDMGDGKGHLYTSQKYLYLPADLNSEKIRTNPDGEIFQVITVGYGVMGAHGAQILPDERWKIVSYIREELHVKADLAKEEEAAKATEVEAEKVEEPV
ncbi:c-type cytochrome [Carboxylicivirga sp. M1479]|uniref:c-type cytochrome n=1 Tax=Carboxylicivirga sp. M1479 TaxID=2594476 RepID=UPI001177AA40|nr:c-type cytochrome [Carboxylicivirga sp. M1479]TRX71061.1 c-type cytochrome [Carboxylicivirga sp. M1479]